jgi:hypothetical protein
MGRATQQLRQTLALVVRVQKLAHPAQLLELLAALALSFSSTT